MGAYIDQELLFRTIDISYRHGINEIVETGTGDGHSTGILSQIFFKVHTIEKEPEVFKMAQNNLSQFNNITQYLGDSADILENFLTPDSKYVFFLDAHSNYDHKDNCPLKKELEIMKSKNIKPPIIIHDFHVPNYFDGGKTARFPSNEYFTIEWIWEDLINLYGEKNFHYYYNVCPTSEHVGILFVEPLIS